MNDNSVDDSLTSEGRRDLMAELGIASKGNDISLTFNQCMAKQNLSPDNSWVNVGEST